MRIEPPVSVPRPSSTSPAASAAPVPPLEPPGMRPVSQGLRVVGVTTPKANSWVWVLPMGTAPAAGQQVHAVGVLLGGAGARAYRPAGAHVRAGRCDHPGHVVEVLHARRECRAADPGSARRRSRPPPGGRPRAPGRPVTAAKAPSVGSSGDGAVERRPHQLDGGQGPGADGLGRLLQRGSVEVHGPPHSQRASKAVAGGQLAEVDRADGGDGRPDLVQHRHQRSPALLVELQLGVAEQMGQ